MDIILATNNAHKVQELRRMLEPLGYTLYSRRKRAFRLKWRKTAPPSRKTPS